MAFLPQFIDPSISALVQSLLYGLLPLYHPAMVWQTFLAAYGHKARFWLARPKWRRSWIA